MGKGIEKVSSPVTIHEVARLSNVSTATVSMALNGNERISEKTAERVLAVADKLRYRPDARARSLRSGKNWNIGVLGSAPREDPFFAETMLSHLVYWFTAEKYSVSFEILSADDDDKIVCPDLVMTNRVDAVVIVGHLDADRLAQVAKWGLPVCLLDNQYQHPNFCSVSVDAESGSREAAQYLAALGHVRIGYVYGTLEWPSSRDKYRGYMEAIRELSLPFKPEYSIRVDDEQQNYYGGFDATVKLLSESPDITAIMYVNDWYAVGGLAALHHLGKRVPEDVSILGFDNSWFSRDTKPGLTSVSLEPELLCHTAALNLIRKTEKKPVNSDAMIRPSLVKRDSCASPRAVTKANV